MKTYALLFNVLTSISVNLGESKAMESCDLNEIDFGPSCI